MPFVRSVFFLLVAWSSIVWGATYLSVWLRLTRDRRALIHRIFVGWGRLMTWAAGTPVTIVGAEHVPAGPFVLAANHQGNLDIPALMGHFPRPFRFVLKAELMSVPFFGRIAREWGFIPIDRQNRDQAYGSLQAAAEIVRRGEAICLFPEGTRTRDGRLARFKRGAFALAAAAEVPVVPVAISGSFRAWPRGRLFWLRSMPLRIAIGPPIAAPSGNGDAMWRDWADQAQQAVASLLSDLEGELSLRGEATVPAALPAAPPRA